MDQIWSHDEIALSAGGASEAAITGNYSAQDESGGSHKEAVPICERCKDCWCDNRLKGAVFLIRFDCCLCIHIGTSFSIFEGRECIFDRCPYCYCHALLSFCLPAEY